MGFSMATETFIVKMQEQNRIAIPKQYIEILKLKKDDKVRIIIEKVRT